jgi:hypothetical protein
MTKQSFDDQFPPVANNRGTKYPIPDPPPRNPARDMPGLPAVVPGGFHYQASP